MVSLWYEIPARRRGPDLVEILEPEGVVVESTLFRARGRLHIHLAPMLAVGVQEKAPDAVQVRVHRVREAGETQFSEQAVGLRERDTKRAIIFTIARLEEFPSRWIGQVEKAAVCASQRLAQVRND